MSQKYIVLLLFMILFSFSVYGRNALDGVGIDRYSSERSNIGFLDQDNAWTGINNFSSTIYVGACYLQNGSSCSEGGSSSFWTQVGNNLYPSTLTNKVGINTTDPTHELHVKGDVNITGTAYIHILDGNSPITVKSNMIFDAGKNITANYYLGSGEF